ncbi:hypothetical protein SRDD_02960 [Serratia sp. DD3]|nr:hypothetical protein SRDD_02960 [Serratia sp. DD3]
MHHLGRVTTFSKTGDEFNKAFINVVADGFLHDGQPKPLSVGKTTDNSATP